MNAIFAGQINMNILKEETSKRLQISKNRTYIAYLCSSIRPSSSHETLLRQLPVCQRSPLFISLFLFFFYFSFLLSISFSALLFLIPFSPLLCFCLISSLFIRTNLLSFFYDSTWLLGLLSFLLIKLSSNVVFNCFGILPLDVFRKYLFSLSLCHSHLLSLPFRL